MGRRDLWDKNNPVRKWAGLLGLFDVNDEAVGVVATTVWELDSQVVFIFPWIQCICRVQRAIEAYYSTLR